MAFKKGQPKPPGSGRKKATPNKPKPLKLHLTKLSEEYFVPDPKTGKSKFDEDFEGLDPYNKIVVQLKLLEYHQPKLKAISGDVTVTAESQSLLDTLNSIYRQNEK